MQVVRLQTSRRLLEFNPLLAKLIVYIFIFFNGKLVTLDHGFAVNIGVHKMLVIILPEVFGFVVDN